jgi:hypothetical protein
MVRLRTIFLRRSADDVLFEIAGFASGQISA